MRINQILRGAAGAATLAIVLTACGGGDNGSATGAGGGDNASAQGALAKIGQQLDSMESWNFTMDLAGPVKMSGTGSYQVSPLAMEMNFSEVDFGGQTAADIKMRLVDDVMYMNMGELAPELGADWIKISSAGSSQFRALTESLRQQDPRVQMRLFASAAGGTKVGTEVLDGIQTTHYTATLNADEIGEVSGLTADEISKLKESFTTGGIQSMTYDVWVDSDFRPLQIKVGMPGTAGDLQLTMRITDINNGAQIKAPPQSEVVELPAE